MAIDRELTLTLGMTATMLACGGTREGTHATEAMTAGARPAFAMRFDVPSHAYRQRVTIYGPPAFAHREGVLFLESVNGGAPRVAPRPDDQERRPLPVTDEDAVALYFPIPDGPLPARRRVALPRLDVGETSGFLELDERIWASSVVDDLAVVHFERVGRAGSGLIVEGTGTFDLASGRYQTLRIESFACAADTGARRHLGTIELTYDPALSRARARRLEALRQARAAGDSGYDAYRAAHGPSVELAEIERALAYGPTQTTVSLIWFHALASPLRVWEIVLRQPDGGRLEDLAWLVSSAQSIGGYELDPSVVALLRSRLADRRAARLLVAGLADERFRVELEVFAQQDDPPLREAAIEALTRIEARTPPSLAKVERELAQPTQAMPELLRRYVATTSDPRPVVTPLIALLSRPVQPAWVHEVVIETLRTITVADHGDDPRAWARFLEGHRTRPYVEWLSEAATDERAPLRLRAIEALTARPPGYHAKRALRRGLSDPHPRVRLLAAEGLARWGDPAGIEVLLPHLDASEPTMRQAAFVALAWLLPETFGYDAHATEMERTSAFGRIQHWARAVAVRRTEASDELVVGAERLP